MAYADDQLIEGIYLPGNQFVVGLQFHPERMYDEYIGNHKVFETYFNAIKAYKK